MIIEITGAPGVGKSTLLKKLARRREKEFLFFSDDLILDNYRLNPIIPDRIKSIISKIVLVLFVLQKYQTYKKFFSFVQPHIKDHPFRFRLHVILSLAFKLGRFEFISKYFPSHTVLVDEGISHIPFNLIVYKSMKLVNLDDAFSCLESATSGINVIVFDHKQVSIRSQMELRGKEILNTSNPELIANFIECNDKIVNTLTCSKNNIFKKLLVFDKKASGNTDALASLIQNKLIP